MYGMMLPSGNDAAFMLAFKLGQVLLESITPVDESL
jgi:D-alanyl-D-alanine carboxypeptidase